MEQAGSTGSTSSVYAPSRELPPVSADELGFALSLFVAAANGRFGSVREDGDKLAGRSLAECQRVLGDLLLCAPGVDASRVLPHQTSLNAAFSQLWKHYEDHGECESICARVIYFQLLMESTRGEVITSWTSPCSEDPEHILLDPAVVDGLACVPIQYEEGLVQSRFLSAIESAHQRRCS